MCLTGKKLPIEEMKATKSEQSTSLVPSRKRTRMVHIPSLNQPLCLRAQLRKLFHFVDMANTSAHHFSYIYIYYILLFRMHVNVHLRTYLCIHLSTFPLNYSSTLLSSYLRAYPHLHWPIYILSDYTCTCKSGAGSSTESSSPCCFPCWF